MHTQVALKPLSPFAATLERQIQLAGTRHRPLEEAQRSLSGEGEERRCCAGKQRALLRKCEGRGAVKRPHDDLRMRG